MKIAFVPFVFVPKLQTSERRLQRSADPRKALRLLGLSIYLLATTSAMFGWIWLLTAIGLELFFS